MGGTETSSTKQQPARMPEPHGALQQQAANVDVLSHEALQDIWALPKHARRVLLQRWRAGLRVSWCEQLADVLHKIDKLQLELRELRNSGYGRILAGARVIGCTTTGAAIYQSLLSSVAVSPG